jgi:hypothetical protein
MKTGTSAVALLVLLTVVATAGAYTLQPISTFGDNGWLAPGSRPYLANDNNQRGMAFNATSNHVYVVNRTGGLSIPILDGTTGADVGTLSTTGIAGGTFVLSTIAVAEDGAIYGANLTTNSATSALKIYRWADESATPALVYSGSPTTTTGVRFGDTLAARGAGVNTQLVMGTGATANTFSIFTTADGTTFGANYMTTTGPANGAFRLGTDFGIGNTVWGRTPGGTVLGWIEAAEFDLGTKTAARIAGAPFTPTANGEALLAIDPGRNLLATADISGGQVRLYDISDPTFGIAAHQTLVFPGTHNTNGNGTGQMDWGNYDGDGRLYVLDSNNGVRAYEIVPEPASLLLIVGGLLLVRRR